MFIVCAYILKLLLDYIFYNIRMLKNLKIIWQYFKIYILMITFLWKHIDLRFLKDFEGFYQQKKNLQLSFRKFTMFNYEQTH
jgi:hypothetical protein